MVKYTFVLNEIRDKASVNWCKRRGRENGSTKGEKNNMDSLDTPTLFRFVVLS